MEYNPYSDDPEFAAVLAYIEEADCIEIDTILNAVQHRYRCHHPDWDILFMALPTDPEKRRADLERMLHMLGEGQLF